MSADRGLGRWAVGVLGVAFAGLLLGISPVAAAPSVASEAVLNDWLAAQTNLVTWHAEFTQTRELSTLTRPLIARGRVWFAAPNRFRWELGDPPQTIAARQPTEILILYPRLKRAERYPLGTAAAGPWKDAMALLDAGFPRSRAELNAAFELVSITATNRLHQVALRPRSATARKMMPEIQLTISADDRQLHGTQMRFMDGSILRNEFVQVLTNAPLDDALFRPVPGAEYQISEPARNLTR